MSSLFLLSHPILASDHELGVREHFAATFHIVAPSPAHTWLHIAPRMFVSITPPQCVPCRQFSNPVSISSRGSFWAALCSLPTWVKLSTVSVITVLFTAAS